MNPVISYTNVHHAVTVRIVKDGYDGLEWLKVVAVGENGEETAVAVIHSDGNKLAPAVEVVNV